MKKNYQLTIDRRLSLKEAINMGKIELTDNSVNYCKKFQKTSNSLIEESGKIFKIGHKEPIKNFCCRVGAGGFRPADIRELLAFSYKYEINYFLLALGSATYTRYGVLIPAITTVGGHRRLSLITLPDRHYSYDCLVII